MRPDPEPIAPLLEERHHELAREVGGFAEEHLASLPSPDSDEAARVAAREILTLLGEHGWCRWAVPAAYGGAVAEIDLVACCLIREALAAASPLADSVFALQCLGSMPLVLAGGDEVKKKWLPRVARGEAMAAFAMTEPEAGSDVRSLGTRATAVDGGYRIDGRKTLITNAGVADFYSVFGAHEEAATASSPDDGRSRISCFVVPATAEGLAFAGPQIVSEPHPLGEIELDGCRVGAESRLGDEGQGFRLGMDTLDRLRATVAAAACGMAARALAESLRRVEERRQFGRPLSGFQLVQSKLAWMATELTAARLLTYRAAVEGVGDGDGADLTLRSAMAKLYATEAAQQIVDQAVQIHGGEGVLADSMVDRLYRAVRALRIYEGTSEIQQLVIARRLLADGG